MSSAVTPVRRHDAIGGGMPRHAIGFSLEPFRRLLVARHAR